MRAERLEQLFIERSAGVFSLLLVLESASGSRERVTLSAPGVDELSTVGFLAGYLRQHGLSLAPKLRVRRRRGGELEDAPELTARLRGVMKDVRRDTTERGPWG